MLHLYLRSILALLADVASARARRPGNICQTMWASAATTYVQMQAALVDTVDQVGRQLGGLVLPFGEAGSTNIGVVTASAASRVELPEDLSRVKLVDYHQEPPRAVGHCVHAEKAPEGWRMRFQLGSSELATDVLVAAEEHVVDSFSVEMTDVVLDSLGNLQSGLVTAVAMVPVPAFASARVDYIAASHNPTEGTNMLTAEQRARLRELLARTDQLTDAERQELDQLTQLAVAEASTDQGAPPAAQEPAAGATSTPAPAAMAAGLVLPTGAALAPAGVQLQAGQSRHTLTDLYAAVSRVATGQSRAHMEAALADITNTANPGVAPTQYDGQLWSGLQYRRRFVPLMAPGNLTAYKGTGWRWATKPEVADYAGDKADVPSNAADTEDAPWTAARLAGAHDFDRKFIDFGDTEFVQAYYEAMRESYAKKSDAKGGAFIVASATAGAAIVGNLLQAAATVATRVEDAVNQEVDYVLVNSTDRLALINMVEDELPAYLAMFGIVPEKFVGTTLVPAGTVVAGVRAASEFKELSETPIRVETVNIAKGGVDGGVFGYYATVLHDADGIQKATFAPA